MASSQFEADRSKIPFEGLPTEIYENIIDHVDYHSLFVLTRVNHLFWIRARRLLFENVYISSASRLLQILRMAEDITFGIAPVVKSFSLKSDYVDCMEQQDVLSLLDILGNNSQLVELTLWMNSSLQIWSQEKDSSASISLLTQPSLKKLILKNCCGLPLRAMEALHVSTLEISACTMGDTPLSAQHIFNFPSARLETLTLCCSGMQGVLLRALNSDSVRILKDLTVTTSYLTFPILSPLLQQAPHLRVLDIHIKDLEPPENLASYRKADLSELPSLRIFIMTRNVVDGLELGIPELCNIFFRPANITPFLYRIRLNFSMWDDLSDLSTTKPEQRTQWLHLDNCLDRMCETSLSLKEVIIVVKCTLQEGPQSRLSADVFDEDSQTLRDFYNADIFPQLCKRRILKVFLYIDDS